MPKYSKEKFKELTDQRKAQVILQSLYELDQSWDEKPELGEIKAYLEWVDSCSDLFRLQTLGEGLGVNSTRRQLLNIIVPIERYLNKNLKDHDLNIQTKDHQNLKAQVHPLFVVLDHLRSSFNVGSIFRTAECLGVSHIYLVGYTPTPDDPGVKKTAMGTDKLMSWSQHDHINEVFEILSKGDIPIVALETSEKAQELEDFKCPDKVAILLGNERFGLESGVIRRADHLVKIPMAGQKNSLNVANTFSIVSYELSKSFNQRGKK